MDVLFYNWRRDTNLVNIVCLSMDFHAINIEELVGTSSEALHCYNMLKLNYGHIMKIHTVLASHSEHFPHVDEAQWNYFIKKT